MQTLSFCSFKGGTGKTTLSLNVGCNLAQEKKKRVLLVDLDPQANLTVGLGVQICEKHNLDAILRDPDKIKNAIHKTKINHLDIIPSSVLIEDFRGFNRDISLTINHLYMSLQTIRHSYDVCILDTPPSLGILTREAFLASQYLIICLTPEPFSILGLQKIKEFYSTIDNDLQVLGIVFSFWDERNSTNSTYLNIVESMYPGKILSSKIRKDITLSRSLLKETSVTNAYPNSRASQDILKLTEEIENKLFLNKKLFRTSCE